MTYSGETQRASGMIVFCSSAEMAKGVQGVQDVMTAIRLMTGVLRVAAISTTKILAVFEEDLWTTKDGPGDAIWKSIMALRDVTSIKWVETCGPSEAHFSVRKEVDDKIRDVIAKLMELSEIPDDLNGYFVDQLRTRTNIAKGLQKSVYKLVWGRGE